MADKEKKKFISEAGGKALLEGILELIDPLAKGVDSLKEFLDSFPRDGQVVAIVNGKAEPIAPEGCMVIYQNPAVAATLEALEKRTIPAGLTPELLEKVKANIPEDIWNELDQAATMDEKSVENKDSERIAMAIAQYRIRKAEETMAEEMARMEEEATKASEERSSDVLPVTPKKGEQS